MEHRSRRCATRAGPILPPSLSSSPSALLLVLFSSHPDLQLFLSYSVAYYQPLFNFSFLSGLWSLSGFGSSYTSIIVLDKISLSVAKHLSRLVRHPTFRMARRI